MRPILLKSHSRPLTKVKFNRESDLLFTCGKDYKPCVFYAENGERIGTYNGHNGSVYDCDISFDSTRLLTGSADRTVKLWEVESGKEILSVGFESAVRSVGFAHGERMFLAVQDNSFKQKPTVFIYTLPEGVRDSKDVLLAQELTAPEITDNIKVALWGNLNQNIYTADDHGDVRVWDVETGQCTHRIEAHSRAINSLQFSKDYSMLITASSDRTSRIYDAKSMTLLKTFQSDRPLNAGAISPIMPHVIVGGGQEAAAVTTTAAQSGKFEVDFHQIIYGDYLGSAKGHFGPVNTLAFSPNGRSFASGGEDGFVRLYHFDKDYFKNKE